MWYTQRGGYTPTEQQRRERLRLEAAGRFARGDTISEIARNLRVTKGSVRRWHRAWQDGGAEALRSKGPVSREKLIGRLFHVGYTPEGLPMTGGEHALTQTVLCRV
jgi:transposase-like protein